MTVTVTVAFTAGVHDAAKGSWVTVRYNLPLMRNCISAMRNWCATDGLMVTIVGLQPEEPH